MIWRRKRDTRSQLMSNSCKKRVKRITNLLWVAYRFRVGVNKAVYWLFITFCLSWVILFRYNLQFSQSELTDKLFFYSYWSSNSFGKPWFRQYFFSALGYSFHRGMLVYQGVYFFVKSCEPLVCVIGRKITPFHFLQFREKPVSIEIGVATDFFSFLSRSSMGKVVLPQYRPGWSGLWCRLQGCHIWGCFLNYLKNIID